jgi:hypothetical protein
MKISCFGFLSLIATPVLAGTDLSLPGERWSSKANGIVCANNTAIQVDTPAQLESFAVKFETVTTDYSLDNGLLKATFVEDGVSCRYSALLLADNAARTLKLVDSVAFAADADANCTNGKAMLDGLLQETSYLYWGRPAHVTILIEEPAAAAVCGEGAKAIGLDFVLTGRVS